MTTMRVGRNATRIKAIPTAYNGITFRSRLEARWAVFFDALGITYVYEPEAVTDTEHAYLPDFWVNAHEGTCYVEIKPRAPSAAEIERHWPKWRLIPGVYDEILYIVCGPPGAATHWIVTPTCAELPTAPEFHVRRPFYLPSNEAAARARKWQPTRTPALSR